MLKQYPFCDISGAKFSPSVAARRTGLEFTKVVEPGEIGKIGKYRGKPTPYGSARLALGSDHANNAEIESLLTELGQHIAVIRECGADTIVFWLTVEYEGDCNLEFSPALLEKVADLGIPWCISVYKTDREEAES